MSSRRNIASSKAPFPEIYLRRSGIAARVKVFLKANPLFPTCPCVKQRRTINLVEPAIRISTSSQRDLEPPGTHVASQLSCPDSPNEAPIVARGLIGIGHRVIRDRLVELIATAQIARDHCRIARLVVGTGQRPAAERGVASHHPRG